MGVGMLCRMIVVFFFFEGSQPSNIYQVAYMPSHIFKGHVGSFLESSSELFVCFIELDEDDDDDDDDDDDTTSYSLLT